MTSSRRGWVAGQLVCLLLGSGCRQTQPVQERRPSSERGPELVLIDSVDLVESDTLFLGQVGQGFDVDESGRLFVAASSLGKILRFSPKGTFEASYGRLGNGPGEFRQVFPVVYAADSIVIGSASRSRRVNVFRASDGLNLATRTYQGFVTAVQLEKGRLWFANFSRRDSMAVGSVAVDSLLSKESDKGNLLQPTLIPLPTEYLRYSELELASDVRILRFNDTLLAAFAPFNTLHVLVDTSKSRLLQVPVRLRRGVPANAYAEFFVRRGHRFDLALGSLSLLEGIWQLGSGPIVLVHMDGRASMKDGKVISVSAQPYLTLLSRDLSTACVDTPIPSDSASRPVVTVEGDMLYVLEQLVSNGAQPTAKTTVRKYRVDYRSCIWVPTK